MIDPIVAALHECRMQLGWSRVKLARRAGLNEATIRNLEDGRSRSGRMETIRAIAQAMDMDLRLGVMPPKTFGASKPGGEDTPANIAERRRVLAEALRGAPGRRKRLAGGSPNSPETTSYNSGIVA